MNGAVRPGSDGHEWPLCGEQFCSILYREVPKAAGQHRLPITLNIEQPKILLLKFESCLYSHDAQLEMHINP